MNEINIAQFLNLSDPDADVTEIINDGTIKYVTVEKRISEHYCPYCGCRMHSKGKFKRHPKHQILQDGYDLHLTVIGRTWVCSSESCDYSFADTFNFVEPNKQVTKLIQIQILHTLKDIKLSTRQVADRFNVSDTYVHQIFMQYVNPKRKSLTEYICIDEVYLNISPQCKYALVIMDFLTGDILDILPSRRNFSTAPYFLSIPKEERDKVKYLICDMYKPYINYTLKYFTNAKPVTDSFHILQWLLSLINQYIRTVSKRYQERDRKALEEQNAFSYRTIQKRKDSEEVYILKNASWVLLRNESNRTYISGHFNHFLGRYMDTYQWEEAFLNLDDNFRTIKNLKDLYEEFNESFINDIENAETRLRELIHIYKSSSISIFHQFAELLERFMPYILNSFTYVKDERRIRDNSVLRRLSNGPMESFNNIPSALRTQSHGILNFEYARSRILWSVREDEPIDIVPRSKEEIKRTGKKRGPYKKK